MVQLQIFLRLLFLALICALPFGGVYADLLSRPQISKDVGPTHALCDGHSKGSDAWRVCLGAARVEMSDEELFYAGYWLAKSGHYEKALTYLYLTRSKNEKILTYIGYATRKLGDVDQAIPFYTQALFKNPNYVVARAYLGEAYLTRGEPDRAKRELQEIERRCGISCPSFRDLEQHIAEYVSAHG